MEDGRLGSYGQLVLKLADQETSIDIGPVVDLSLNTMEMSALEAT